VGRKVRISLFINATFIKLPLLAYTSYISVLLPNHIQAFWSCDLQPYSAKMADVLTEEK